MTTFSDEPTVLMDFVARLLEDRAAGSVLPLAEYVRSYPGHEESVAREYARLHDERPDEPEIAGATVGPYNLVCELGRGGQGVVYLAEDTRLSRRVALKLLPPHLVDDRARQRQLREAALLSRIHHPGICTVYDVGLDPDRGAYLAMHYVEGQSLARCINSARARPGRATAPVELPDQPPGLTLRERTERVVLMIERVARSLHAAHEAGVVHRDLKPGNILITAAGRPVVVDFGLARGEGFAADPLTMVGELLGTPPYLAPEQVDVKPRQLDHRTDIWALCVVAFECLTLRQPFAGRTHAALFESIRHASPAPAQRHHRGIEAQLAAVLGHGLEKDPEHRYQTAAELADDLARWRSRQPVRATPPTWLRCARSWVRRHVGASIAAAVAV
ncbi:MAG: serine/threonine protein kinase, partial [Planctomycetes bacterium]|nr:serine/threonine protein kinase [Planctomycetota bacterium]